LKTKFPRHEVTTTLQCCGNRREDLHGERRIFIAPHWVIGAISTAKWEGVKVRDVLKYCGVNVDAYTLGTSIKDNPHWTDMQFQSYDIDECGTNFGISIPLDKVMDPFGDTLFAFGMNGKPLPRDHGFPVRAIVPGHAGKCSAKWLHKVTLSSEPSKTSYQRKSYCHFPNDVDFEGILSETNPTEIASGKTIQELPVQSFVCNPPQNSIVGMKDASDLLVKGVAWSGGGKGIHRVEISVDGGKTFVATDLYKPSYIQEKERRNHEWTWTQFSKRIALPHDVKTRLKRGEVVNLDICSKALNTDFNVQPETMAPYWNPRGVAINHWYHVSVKLDPHRPKGVILKMSAA
jgi:sulfite oxidase